MKPGVLFILAFTYVVTIGAQSNLIPNPGFEEYHECPTFLSDFNGVVKFWFTPSAGTPNYYNVCGKNPEVGVPNNYFGVKASISGAAYVGIMTSNAFREYISVPLTAPLRAGQAYRLSLYTSVIQNNGCTSTGLDILFSTTLPNVDLQGTNIMATPSLTAIIDYANDRWVRTELCYVAKGNEKYLTIGDLQYPAAHHTCKDGNNSYYFIDEVTLQPLPPILKKEVQYSACNQTFPFELNGAMIASITQDIDQYEWLWDGVFKQHKRIIEKPGFYKLFVASPDCVQSEYQVQILDQDCNHNLFMPNIFTPNDDGLNDVVKLNMRGIEFEKISIINRLGQVVFESKSSDFQWTGQLGSTPLGSGVYVYVITYWVKTSGRYSQKTGSITLVR